MFADSILYTFFYMDKFSCNVNCTFDSFDSFVKLLVSIWIEEELESDISLTMHCHDDHRVLLNCVYIVSKKNN